MIVNRTERHIMIGCSEIESLCFLSKNLYNYCNFILRQIFINKRDNIQEYIDLIKEYKINDKIYYNIKETDLITRLTKLKQKDYISLPRQTSQQIIKLLFKNWKSFFKSLKEYKIRPEKFKGRPRLPRYKKKLGRNIIIFTNQQCTLKDEYIYFPKMFNLKPLKTKVDNIQQVRIIPRPTCFIIEIVYKKNIEINESLNENLYVSIDLGINNFTTLTNNVGLKPFIINGRIIKSINQYFNKEKSRLQSFIGDKGTSNRIEKLTLKRNCKVQDYLHKTSRFIINYCIQNNIKNIVIGYNKDWKNEINLGKINNQKFINIPFETFIKQIEYKSEEVGIKVILINESYSSKCSALDLEEIKKQETYLGRRVKRGLFKTGEGKLINSDINGSLNILRKVIGDDYLINPTNRGLVFNPLRVNSLKTKDVKIS